MGANQQMLLGALGFTGAVHTYNSATPGSGSETAPVGAAQCVVEAWGVGAGGFRDHALVGNFNAAPSGGYSKKTVAVTGGTTSFTYNTTSTPGAGRTGGDGLGGDGSTNFVVSCASPSFTLTLGPAKASTNAGGTATGGDTNTAGNTDTSASDGPAPGAPNGGSVTPTSNSAGAAGTGSTPGGGGGGQTGTGSGGAGGTWQVTFTYT